MTPTIISELNGKIGNPIDYHNIAWTGLRKSFDGLLEIRDQLGPNDAESQNKSIGLCVSIMLRIKGILVS